MKKILAAATAVLSLAACNKSLPVAEPASELTATMEMTKSHLDGMTVLWDANDEISVFTMEEGAYKHSKFATADEGATAVFKGPGITADENLLALYPYNENSMCSATYGISTIADFTSQKVVNGTFDKNINLAVGKFAGEKNVSFRNVGALLKFKLTQERADTVRRIELKTNDGTPIAIDGDFNIPWNDGAPYIDPSENATRSDLIKLNPASGAFATGDTYYVWVLPGEYQGITLTLVSPTQMTAVKAGTGTLKIARNQIVDLGEIGGLTFKAKEAEKKTLHFDFSGEPQKGWPTADKWKNAPGDSTCVYKLDGVDYEFILTDCGNASQARVAWVKDKGGLVWFAGWRYVGLPALEGFKLIKVTGCLCLASNSKRQAGITKSVVADNTTDTNDFVTGGEAIAWATNGEVYSYNLEDTAANTVYYLCCTATSIGTSYLDLTYEKVE